MSRREWLAQELAMLRDLYPVRRAAEVAELLDRPIGSVYAQAAHLGLHKSAEFQASDKSGRIFKGGVYGQRTQFADGAVPWNAGRHYVPGGRAKETQFKPGMRPASTLPVGSYRIVTSKNGARHVERKVREAKGANHKRWTPVSRLVWEAAHGPVPEGHVVVFRPGMRTLDVEQITLDRVECITRAENARRNHPWNHSPELARLINLRGHITRHVNRIAREGAQGKQLDTQHEGTRT